MAQTIDAAFRIFLDSLRTLPAETAAAKGHRATLLAKLQAEFGCQSMFRTGSFGAGTNIAGYSDVDYFAIIPAKNLKQNSASSLAQVAQALRDRYPNTQNIRVNGPGVSIPFGFDGAHATEVIPVDCTGETQLGFRQFDMPDGAGGWMFSAPESHKQYVQTLDDKHNGSVKPLIRFIKAWKFYRSVPVKSFYLEMRTAEYASRQGSIIFVYDLALLFCELHGNALADLLDPRFPNDGLMLKACNTTVQRQDALTKLEMARDWALDASAAYSDGKIAKAFDKLDLLFNYHFPSYG